VDIVHAFSGNADIFGSTNVNIAERTPSPHCILDMQYHEFVAVASVADSVEMADVERFAKAVVLGADMMAVVPEEAAGMLVAVLAP
jgi:hypothetical protein